MSENQFVLYGYLMMHKAVRGDLAAIERQAAGQLDLSTETIEKLEKKFDFYWQLVEHHHLVEDNGFFADLLTHSPQLAAEFEALTGEHHVIDALVAAIKDTLKTTRETADPAERQENYGVYLSVVREMNRRMNAHLDREEAAVIPAVCAKYTSAEQMAMEEAIIGAMPDEHKAVLFPWMLASMEPEDRAVAYMSMPEPLRRQLDSTWQPRYEQITLAFA